MSEQVDWRARYRALAQEAEQHEQKLATALEQMRSLAAQLDLITHGESPVLDALLKKVTAELQSGGLESVQDLLRKTQTQVRRIEESKGKLAGRLTQPCDDWIAFLLQQDIRDTYGTRLSQAKQSLAEENINQLPGLLDTLLDIQKQLIPVHINSSDSNDLAACGDVLSARLASRLLDLIQLLSVPSSHAARVHSLIKRLESSPDASALEECLNEVSELVKIGGGNLETDIQEYLESLNSQLTYLRSFMDGADDSDQKQRRRNNLLDQSVRQNVKHIHTTVQKAQDINGLKQAVSTQLAGIIKAMNRHKVAEEQHLIDLKEERKALLTRIDEMEMKTEYFRKSAEDAHMKSMTDPLTGLPNRLAYERELEKEMERFKRYDTPFSLCVADLDYFKTINDKYGHLAGDKVLRLIARVLRSNLRGVDFVARIGGEEFVIILPSTDGESARQAAENIRQAVEQSPFNFQGSPVQVSISLGIAQVQPDDDIETLFGRADSNVYMAKREGRNQVRFG
ncbi:GGDEF domain-containing protein [Marinobacterium mangrovicola]|uniref:diguanylate cyclase n=1 Tax=Marinobacterium mangrovicola TaxID=1476959 RepID=A0A4R1GND8_9GAMM|nr:GGDEF domain-containing protein [Marinobacterium mangrovicola]TCK08730.1 diguanylate cyclase (GGDEF)-like protein [Marinobacterium mangrovicola]